tara:strand:- start:986 stop:1459 length:474 start_codon:yes stop_codon:yes gene_type:complete
MRHNMKDIPTPNGHDVYWEKWIDAYEEQAALLEQMVVEEDEEEFYEEEEEMEKLPSLSHIKTIMTPFGIMPLTEHSLASSHFKFWVGHANFKLTEKVYQVVGNTEGVESLDILTPYRFRIAIGKMFVDRNVMSTVRTNLLEYIKDANHEQENEVRRQ